VAGFCGVLLLIIGLVALGFTQSPRPSFISHDIYGRMKQIEMVIAILFVTLGMVIVRFTIAKVSKAPEEP
jgi:amino acid transporter